MPRRCERRTLPIELIPHDEYVSLDQKDILGGTRTLNLEIRSLTPYPVRPRGLRYLLRMRSNALSTSERSNAQQKCNVTCRIRTYAGKSQYISNVSP